MPNRPRSLGTLIVASLTLACSPDSPVAPISPGSDYGQIRLTISTEGVDIDPRGHEVTIGPVGDPGDYHSIPSNGTWTIRLRASVTYVVSLVQLSPNCIPVEAETWQVTVVPDWATDISLRISCSRLQGILVSESGLGFQALGMVYADGSAVRDLGPGSAPTWSPNGEFIALVSQVCDPDVHPSCTSLTLATLYNSRSDLTGPGISPAWHPGGEFVATVQGNELYRVRLEAPPRLDLLAELPVDSAADLDWSRDGTRLAFTCVLTAPTDDAPARSDICLIRADGSGFEVLTREPGSHAHPAWHPDGRIAFSTTRFGELSVATMAPDGSGIARLTAGSDPAWSPDGTELALIRAGATPGLFVVNHDGSGERLLANGQLHRADLEALNRGASNLGIQRPGDLANQLQVKGFNRQVASSRGRQIGQTVPQGESRLA